MSRLGTGDSGADRNPLRETDWGELLSSEFTEQYWADLQARIEGERSYFPVYPPPDEVFRALKLTRCDQTKVVIVGQDPYHAAGQADGLCFSVPRGVRRPPSLVNIHKELQTDLGMTRPDHGSLESWAHRGVLLLNTTLTVQGGEPGSHRGWGWKHFTDAVIRIVTEETDPVFLLWGKEAQGKEKLIRGITGSPGKIIKSSHPSPPAAFRPCLDSPSFIRSKPFSKANKLLLGTDRGGIDWNLPP